MAELQLRNFKFEDLIQLEDAIGEYLMKPTEALELEKYKSFTGFVDGEIMGCAGIVPLGRNRHFAWAHISPNAKKHPLLVIKAIKRFCGLIHGRIEATVLEDFDEGHRFAEACGFELETPNPMDFYFDDGRGAYLYARVNR